MSLEDSWSLCLGSVGRGGGRSTVLSADAGANLIPPARRMPVYCGRRRCTVSAPESLPAADMGPHDPAPADLRMTVMDLQSRLDALVALAEEIGLTVRREPLGGDGGGYCVLRGRRILFVDTSADLETSYERTLEALAPLPELDQRYLRPEIREDLERQQEQRP